MFEEVKKILAEQLHIDAKKIKLDSKIKEDLGADSLDVLQLLMTIEEQYGTTIPDEELEKFTTVKDIVNYMETLKK